MRFIILNNNQYGIMQVFFTAIISIYLKFAINIVFIIIVHFNFSCSICTILQNKVLY